MGLARRAEARQVRRFYNGSDAMFSQARPDESQPPGTDLIPQLKHIVLLMMENHSFDNYLGTLGRGEGLVMDGTRPAPVKDGDTTADLRNTSDTGQVHSAPTQSWHATHLQYANGANNGFRHSVRQTVPKATAEQIESPLRYWTKAELPFYAGLAETFPVADHWFCSCLGPTFPNRRFLIAGTADGLIDDLPFGMIGHPKAGTIFDLLTRNNIQWTNYHAVRKPRLWGKHMFGRGVLHACRRIGLRLGRYVPTLLHATLGNLQYTADLYPLGFFGVLSHLRSHQQFFADAKNGTLPPVSLVDPDFSDFSEENPQDIAKGEQFAARVINAVMHGPGWRDTLLIWFYDEHGGYYDHVPPPEAVEPDDKPGRSLLDSPAWVVALLRRIAPAKLAAIEAIDGDSDRRYDRLGFRVPAVIVSPYAKPDVVSDIFDHTSVLRLIEDKWNLPSLTRRDAAANSPLVALDLTADPAPFEVPPKLPAPSLDGVRAHGRLVQKS